MKELRVRMLKLAVVAAVFGVWQLAVDREFISSAILPSPSTIAQTVVVLMGDSAFWANVAASMQRVVLALSLSIVIGTLMGLAIGYVRAFEILFQPLIHITQPIPKIMLYPVFIIAFGFGELSRTLYIFLGCFYIIVFAAYQGVRHIDRVLIDAARSLGASKSQVFFKVVLPACLPYVFGGIKSAIGLALILMFFSETIGTRVGLGYFVMLNWSWLNMPQVFAGILITSALGLIMIAVLDAIERRLFVWRRR